MDVTAFVWDGVEAAEMAMAMASCVVSFLRSLGFFKAWKAYGILADSGGHAIFLLVSR